MYKLNTMELNNNKLEKYALIVLAIITLLILTSCKSAKIVEKEYIHTTDSVLVDREIIKTVEVIDSFIVEVPCDDKGILKPFNQRINSGGNIMHIWSNNGKIHAKLFLKATEQIKAKERIVKDTVYIKSKAETIIKYKERYWLWIWFVLSLVIFALLIKGMFK